MEWSFVENRPFLCAAHGLVFCHSWLSHSQEAIAVMERILAWNPDHNQGIRFMIGSEYLRAGEEEKAESFFVTEAAEHPPYRYELALLLLRRAGRWRRRRASAVVSSRTATLRNSFAETRIPSR